MHKGTKNKAKIIITVKKNMKLVIFKKFITVRNDINLLNNFTHDKRYIKEE